MPRQVTVALDNEHQEILKEVARQECTSVATIVRMAIRDFLKNREEKNTQKEV